LYKYSAPKKFKNKCTISLLESHSIKFWTPGKILMTMQTTIIQFNLLVCLTTAICPITGRQYKRNNMLPSKGKTTNHWRRLWW
jgi:hypothetical protein